MKSRSPRSQPTQPQHDPLEAAAPVCYWRCPNCGQVHFGDSPPDTCDFCRDFTTWQPIQTEPVPPPTNDPLPASPPPQKPPSGYVQLHLPLDFDE